MPHTLTTQPTGCTIGPPAVPSAHGLYQYHRLWPACPLSAGTRHGCTRPPHSRARTAAGQGGRADLRAAHRVRTTGAMSGAAEWASERGCMRVRRRGPAATGALCLASDSADSTAGCTTPRASQIGPPSPWPTGLHGPQLAAHQLTQADGPCQANGPHQWHARQAARAQRPRQHCALPGPHQYSSE